MTLETSQRHAWGAWVGVADAAIGALSLYLAYLVRAKVLVAFPDIWTSAPRLFPTYVILLIGTLPILLIALRVSGAYNMARMRSTLGALATIVRAMGLASVAVLAFA